MPGRPEQARPDWANTDQRDTLALMHTPWLTPVTLEHEHVRLEPLEPRHAAALATAAHALDTFRYFSRYPAELTEPDMREFIEFLLGPASTVPFCVIEPASGEPVGITTYLDIRPAHRRLEIGWTWYAPRARSTRLNPAAKLLLLGHAFDQLDAVRVTFRTDERNTQSRAAILKLGATFEGILREDVIMPDSFRRSTAMYSVLAAEWGRVKAGLLERLETAT